MGAAPDSNSVVPCLRGEISIRSLPRESDSQAIRAIVTSSGFFSAAEIDVAVELIDDRLTRGEKSDYRFLFADLEGELVGYTCYGEIACTVGSYDLYWIAVHEKCRGLGLGKRLDDQTVRAIAAIGGRRVYAETSGKAQYEPTRAFYRACGYFEEGRFKDFYAPGDDKVVFTKIVG